MSAITPPLSHIAPWPGVAMILQTVPVRFNEGACPCQSQALDSLPWIVVAAFVLLALRRVAARTRRTVEPPGVQVHDPTQEGTGG